MPWTDRRVPSNLFLTEGPLRNGGFSQPNEHFCFLVMGIWLWTMCSVLLLRHASLIPTGASRTSTVLVVAVWPSGRTLIPQPIPLLLFLLGWGVFLGLFCIRTTMWSVCECIHVVFFEALVDFSYGDEMLTVLCALFFSSLRMCAASFSIDFVLCAVRYQTSRMLDMYS